jgi:hypothetical protein
MSARLSITPDQFEQHARERVDVGTFVDHAAELLGGHVLEAAEKFLRLAQRMAPGGRISESDCEVHDVDVVTERLVERPGDIPVDQQVRRLDPAMDESACVCGVERTGRLLDDRDGPVGRDRPDRLDHIGDVDAVDEAHVDEQASVEVTEPVNGNDVRVAQAGGQLRFPLEPGAELVIIRQPCGQPLEGDHPLALGVESTEHLTHSAAAEQCLEAVGPEQLFMVRAPERLIHTSSLARTARLVTNL